LWPHTLVNIALPNFVPLATATGYSYGMPQDNAAKSGDVTNQMIPGAGAQFWRAMVPR
jgi:hypothetical protein